MSELWQRLRQARKFADLTQQDLATRCGVSRGAVALWESSDPQHRTKPTTDHLIAISKITKAPLEWLMNDASDVNEIWRQAGEYYPADNQPPTPEVLPDLRQDGHLFVFAQTPEQIATKLAQLSAEPPDVQAHLVLIGVSATVHTAATVADALSSVVQVLTKNP